MPIMDDSKPKSTCYYSVVNEPTYTFTWPLVQPKPSWWRRVLRLIRR